MFERFANASGFIFDCDGTLLDTMGIWRDVEHELIGMAGGELTHEDYIEFQAVSIEDGAKLLHERYGVGNDPSDIVSYADGRLLDFYRYEARAFDGSVEFVRKLREQGVPCCIVSSSPVRYLEAGMRRGGFTDLIEGIVSTETAGFSKRERGIYQAAVDLMGSQMQTTWAVDDSLYALKAMKASGLRTIGYYCDDQAGAFDQLELHADIAVRSFSELIA